MSRFVVGEKVPFVDVRTSKDSQSYQNCYGRFMPMGRFTVASLSVHLMECIEAHKVPWSQDPNREAKYDGYVFKDTETEELWNNQYPTASYGQLDDSANWMIRRYVKEPLFIGYRHCARYYLDRLAESTEYLKTNHLSRPDLTPENRSDIEDVIQRATAHIEQISILLKEQLGVEVTCEHMSITNPEVGDVPYYKRSYYTHTLTFSK